MDVKPFMPKSDHNLDKSVCPNFLFLFHLLGFPLSLLNSFLEIHEPDSINTGCTMSIK